MESQDVQTALQVNVGAVGAQGGLGAPQAGRTGHHSQDLPHQLTREGSTGYPVMGVGMGMTIQGQVSNLRGDADAGSAGPWAWNDCADTGALLLSWIRI